jgi:hypothetical protein
MMGVVCVNMLIVWLLIIVGMCEKCAACVYVCVCFGPFMAVETHTSNINTVLYVNRSSLWIIIYNNSSTSVVVAGQLACAWNQSMQSNSSLKFFLGAKWRCSQGRNNNDTGSANVGATAHGDMTAESRDRHRIIRKVTHFPVLGSSGAIVREPLERSHFGSRVIRAVHFCYGRLDCPFRTNVKEQMDTA